MTKSSHEMEEQWQNDPKNWKFCFFYFNPEDKRIFPPKRISGIGWTINFANPKSIVAFLIMIAFFAFVIYMIESNI